MKMSRKGAGIIILLILIILALCFASKGEGDMSHYLEGVSIFHPFGYDTLGRDLFSRTMYALLVSFSLSALSTFLSVTFALFFLLLSRTGGMVRAVVVSLIKAVKILPGAVIAIFLLSFGGNGFIKLILSLSLSGGASLFIFLKPLIERMEKEEYIEAERSLGIGERRIFLHHIVPSLFPYIVENSAESCVLFILTEASLSFLNLGLDASIPTLGRILYEGRSVILSHPHMMIGPAVILFLLSLSLLLIKEGLSELYSSSH